MLTVNELIKYTIDTIDIDKSYEEACRYDYDTQDELLDEIHAIKRKLLDDWYERFNGNKTLALFTLNHIYDVYFEQGGDDSISIEKFIWNDRARQRNDFMYELQTRLLSNLGWVSL